MHLTRDYYFGDIGIIRSRVEKDKYSNEVSKIVLPSYTFRMVHHTSVESVVQKATIYFRRGVYLKFRSYQKAGDSDYNVEIGGYRAQLDQTRYPEITTKEGWPELFLAPSLPHDPCEALFTCIVLSTIQAHEDKWEYRDALPKADSSNRVEI